MIKESRYILRRILIGVGIVLVLSFFNGCKVKALTLMDGTVIADPPATIMDNNYPFYVNKFGVTTYRLVYSTQENLIVANNSGDGGASGVFLNKSGGYEYNTKTGVWSATSNDTFYYDSRYTSCSDPRPRYFNKIIYKNNGSISLDPANYSSCLIIPVLDSELSNWNATKITNNDVIIRYDFRPEFSNFNTNDFKYSYTVGDNPNWLLFNENNHLIKINNNTSIKIRISKVSDNTLLHTYSFTVTSIGTFNTSQTYDIKFSGEYRTTNYLSNNVTSKSSSIISEYQIYVDYLPKSSLLKYQYQYVPLESSLDNSNWSTVSQSDNGSITYVANENGSLYARILDSNNNVVKTSTFTVTTIGTLALDNDSSKFKDFYSSLRDKIDFGGPIGSLINIPVTLLQTISDSFNGFTGVCSNYNLGNLFGYNLHLPCVNVKHYLGNTLYNTIDVIISCVMIYYIFKMLSNAYYQFLLLESTPIPEDMSNSLNVSYRGW